MPFCTASHSAWERSGPSPISRSFDGICLRTRSKISITSVRRLTGRKFDKCTRIFSFSLANSALGRILVATVNVAVHEVIDHFDVVADVELAQGAVAQIIRDGGDAVA